MFYFVLFLRMKDIYGVTIHTYARFRINLRLSSVNCNDDAHKMPKNRHFGAGSDTMQQVHGAGVNSNYTASQWKRNLWIQVVQNTEVCYNNETECKKSEPWRIFTRRSVWDYSREK